MSKWKSLKLLSAAAPNVESALNETVLEPMSKYLHAAGDAVVFCAMLPGGKGVPLPVGTHSWGDELGQALGLLPAQQMPQGGCVRSDGLLWGLLLSLPLQPASGLFLCSLLLGRRLPLPPGLAPVARS